MKQQTAKKAETANAKKVQQEEEDRSEEEKMKQWRDKEVRML